ncbi:efflux RND transporter periplasmic adaptor subunit [Pseudidiomarina salilacus]|uniref:efflux RND transporter periplasmic adaptor subunit n=1 Tax=Pseudidiomarina salilacus TaxID=3384452 RepID=UPI0039855D42
MRRAVRNYLWIIAVVALLAAYIGYQKWQGPELGGYVVIEAPLVQRVVAAGRVTNEARLQVSSELAGLVLERRVAEGDKVSKGDILLILRAEELKAQLDAAQAAVVQLEQQQRPQALAELERAQTVLAQATRERERREALLAAELTTTELVEQARQAEIQAETALVTAQLQVQAVSPTGTEAQRLQAQVQNLQAQLAKATIRAPAAGTLLTRNFETGDVVQPGTVLFTMALESAVEVRTPLDERNLPQLALGQPAQIIADAYPNQPFAATLSFISPAIDAQRGTVEVRLQITEPPQFLRQDMTVSVTIETARREQALVVPNEVIFTDSDGQQVVWRVNNDSVTQQPVELGLRGLTMSEIKSGLNSGDQVLAEAPDDVRNGQRIRFKSQPILSSSD